MTTKVKLIAFMVTAISLAMMVGTTAAVEAGKIKVTFGDVSSYFGKGSIKITNLDSGKTLVSEKLNFAKQHANQGDDCCVKVYTFKNGGNDNGDQLRIKVKAAGGSWASDGYTFHSGLIKMVIDLDEVGE